MNLFIHTASDEASEAAMYSDSVEDFATVHCFELDQLTAAPFNINTYPTCIGVTVYNELLVTSITKKHILSSFQVLQD
ncbi:hypothetical protein OV015_25485, partial [Salmonella enterica subsp. enterica serovar 1,4,[5],12:i:-]|nr:hypothetical protein [Salmonella enterica subsp. enterica serovar 1,4,[5],12:i:-]